MGKIKQREINSSLVLERCFLCPFLCCMRLLSTSSVSCDYLGMLEMMVEIKSCNLTSIQVEITHYSEYGPCVLLFLSQS